MHTNELMNLRMDVLAHDHLDMVCAFSCGEFDKYGDLDHYFHNRALNDRQGVTYIVYDQTKPAELAAVAMITLTCSAIMAILDETKRRLDPAVEIKMFALDQKYQHIHFEDNKLFTIGDFMLSLIIEYISTKTKTVFGADRVVLYANSEDSERFYHRNGFKSFEMDMKPSDDFFVEGCIPMYLILE